jgi:peptidoglycan hydrolase CwlO-like protein
MQNFSKIGLLVIVAVFSLLPNFSESITITPASFCPSFTENIDRECEKLGIDRCREVLDECEKYYQNRSEQYQTEIAQIKNKQKNLQNEIYSLSKKVKNLEYKIYKNNLIIKDLDFQIGDTGQSIKKTEEEIEKVKEKLSLLLQLRYEEDQKPLLEVFLAGDKLSDLFDNFMALETLNQETQDLLRNVKELKNSLEQQRNLMLSEKSGLENTQILVSIQKEESQNLQKQKKTILEKTKGEEALFQEYLKETKEKAKEIRAKIFELAQVGEGESLTLEQAYSLAREVERITGIRAALLLGLLKVESDIGKNVGQCNCGNRSFCRYPNISWKDVMTRRQWSYFERITTELGLNPNTTPVSCSVNGGKVQWGGAMGPAQFIPETWLSLGYKERVEAITGIKPANPWRVKDAFLASGLYLSDWGAASQSETKEIGAVRAYLCGTTKLTWTCRIAGGASYTYSVMKNANQFQEYIDKGILE